MMSTLESMMKKDTNLYMNKKYLIITAAHLDSNRNEDYENSIKSIMSFYQKFDRIFLLECVSKKMDELEYLNKYPIEIVISDFQNHYENYGINEFLHINLFLKKQTYIKEDDTIVKITGRYLMKNDNLIKRMPLNNERILAKLDGDIWDKYTGNNNIGVHTFYFAFKKIEMSHFISYLFKTKLIESTKHIEWILKDYITSMENSSFYEGEMGVETNFKCNGLKVIT
jgi:hypothetical protein